MRAVRNLPRRGGSALSYGGRFPGDPFCSVLCRFRRGFLCALLWTAMLLPALVHAAPPAMLPVVPGKALRFPADFGAHPGFRTEWWYATGWLEQPDGQPLGFQVTFFRSATDHDPADPSRFAPKQLIIAHAALSDPRVGRLQHGQRIAREGFGLAYSKTGDTDVAVDDWQLRREAGATPRYLATVRTDDFAFTLQFTPTQPLLLQGAAGYSRKGPQPQEASYYYSEPQLQVDGEVVRQGKSVKVRGTAWLDHEWSTTVLDANAAGWDWTGINFSDGSSLMAFQIRPRPGLQPGATENDRARSGAGAEPAAPLWASGVLRDAQGNVTHFDAGQIRFTPQQWWRSPRTGTRYPVAMTLQIGGRTIQLAPLMNDQELDSRQSTGAVYWEGAVTARSRTDAAAAPGPVGHGYLELTGYLSPLKL